MLLAATTAALALSLAGASAPVVQQRHADGDGRPRAFVLDLVGDAVGKETRKSITGLVVVKLTNDRRLDVVSGQELKGLANLAADKQEAGCDDSCLAEIAGAMDARLVVSGFVGKLGSLYVVNLSLFDAQKARAIGRTTVEAEKIEDLSARLGPALEQMLSALPVPKPRPRVPTDEELEAANAPPYLAMGLVGGGALALVAGGALAAFAGAMYGDAQTARSALDEETARFDGDVTALAEAHDGYVEKRDAYNAGGTALLWAGALLVVAGAGAAVGGGVLWVSE